MCVCVFCAVPTFLSLACRPNSIYSEFDRFRVCRTSPEEKEKHISSRPLELAFTLLHASLVKVDVSNSDRSIMDENYRSSRRLLNKKNQGRDSESIPVTTTIDSRLDYYQRSMISGCSSYNFGFSSWLHRRRILTKLCRVTIRFIFMYLFKNNTECDLTLL